MKVAILTFHRAYNCGAMLQAWALQTVLERKGCEVIFPDCNEVGEWHKLRINKRDGILHGILLWLWRNMLYRGLPAMCQNRFGRFLNKCMKHGNLTKEEWAKLDLVVVGSDQVWNEKCAGKDAPMFLGSGVPASVTLVGYDISVGDKPLEESCRVKLQEAGRTRFRRLSWRESSLRDALELPGPVVCDPTMLLAREDYRRIEHPSRLVKGRYLFVYAVSNGDEVVAVARKVAKELSLTCVSANVYREDFLRTSDPNIWALTPDKFLAYIRDAAAVVVSSFHGCVFSVLYGKPFVCLFGDKTGDNDAQGRQQNLLRGMGLIDRRMSTHTPIAEIVDKISSDYAVDMRNDALRTSSYDYIEEMLDVAKGRV